MSNTHWEFKIRKPGPMPTYVKMIVVTMLGVILGICTGLQHGYELGKKQIGTPVTIVANPDDSFYPKPIGESTGITESINFAKDMKSEGRYATGYGRLAFTYEHPYQAGDGDKLTHDNSDYTGDMSRLAEVMRCYPCEKIPGSLDAEEALDKQYLHGKELAMNLAIDKDYVQDMYKLCKKYRAELNGDQTK